MKLYLASKHVQFPKELVSLVGSSDPKQVRAKLVVNAFDNYPEDRRQKHVSELQESLSKTRFSIDSLDLREYINRRADLVELLKKSDFLWISGGNIFSLRYLLRECGLDKSLATLINNGLVYGGDSAGAAVIGPDLHGLDLLDDVSEAPELIYTGLNITSFIILPHWGNERYQKEIANSKAELEKYNDEIITISDSQVCIVDGDHRNILGKV